MKHLMNSLVRTGDWVQAVAISSMLVMASFAGAAEAPPTGFDPDRTFGSDRNVALLAQLLTDEDPRVRAQAVADLGETDNLDAADAISKGLKDDHPTVRASALQAAVRLRHPDLQAILRKGMADPARMVKLAAVRAVDLVRSEGQSVSFSVLFRNTSDPLVLAATLRAATRHGEFLATADLIEHRSPRVSIRAMQNVRVASGRENSQSKLVGSLERFVEDRRPAFAAEAIASLGHLMPASALPHAQRAAESESPLLRRAAVRVFVSARKGDRIRPFLKDSSPLVRLAAIRAAGQFKRADCVTLLLERLTDKPSDAHYASVQSLREIGGRIVTENAAGLLEKLTIAIDQRFRDDLTARNVASLCRLLGDLESPHGLETRLSLASSLSLDVKVLADVAHSLGGTNTQESIDGLKGLMARYNKVAPRYLSAMARGSTPPAYSQHVVGAIAEALADAGVTEHVPVLLIAATLKFSDMRLSEQTAAIAAALPKLATKTNRDKIASTLVSILEDTYYSEPDVYFQAAIAAGKLRVEAATPALRRILLQSRKYRDQMLAAQWALKQIHGKAPDMPDPVQKQGDWIVRTEGS